MEFNGKVAVITGAASGIGRSLALALANRGTDIVIADIDDIRLAEVRQKIISIGCRVLALHCDVSRNADVEDLAKQAIATMGKVDILVNNAGTAVYGNFERMSITNYEVVFNINILGVVRGVLAFLPYFIKQGNGYIINTSSAAGLNGGSDPYTVSKYAVVGYSEGLYAHLRPKGIMVSVLCPGLVNTNLRFNATYVGNDQEIAETKSQREKVFTAPTSLQPEDIAELTIEAMQEGRFLILPSNTENYLINATNRGRDIQKLEEYLQERYKMQQ